MLVQSCSRMVPCLLGVHGDGGAGSDGVWLRTCATAVMVLMGALLTAPGGADVRFAPLPANRIDEISALLSASPAGFGSTYHDRAAWDALRHRPTFAEIIPKAEKLLAESFPAWDDALYLDYSRTGRRPPGQAMMGRRTAWLAPLVWAECRENKGRFVPRLEMVLHEYTRQPTWTLPAHDGNLASFHRRDYSVDLGAASFAHELAQALYLLDDKIRPAVRQEVTDALTRRVFDPVRESLRTGKGSWWLTTTSNWNAVCLAGVTGAALAVLPDRRDRAFFVAGAERYSRNSVDGFNNDGFCTEGLGYYNYGFWQYIVLREALYQATQGKLDLFNTPKVRKIALFGPNLEIENGSWPAFADCRFGTTVSPEILWYCSRVLGLGLHQYESLDVGGPGSLVNSCMETFPNSASVVKQGEAAPPVGLRSYFEDSGVLIVRPSAGTVCRLGAALKGGNNNEHHNHNDLGSYAVVLGQQQLAGDPGGPHAYTNKTFGPERYTAFKTFASYGHPVPLIAGKQQVPGARAVARILRTNFTDAGDEFAMDISSAYPVPGLKKLVRTFHYDRQGQGSLAITDDFAFAGPETFEVALITHAKWERVAADTLEFSDGGERLQATITAPGAFTVTSEVVEEDAPPWTRIGIRLQPPLAAGSVTVTYHPAPASATPSPAPTYRG